ncbi:dihydroxyacetone kinase subunit DhaL [Cellulomonas terrae]|uniref:Dihydroxyacetone kinase subunit L n=1 Tax=Cellulomonas terrae TaxID=311234 RepID=A0A511JLI5_9CELL|nr:dihydroxyacetone kinase subunit DhaL [Cellulomonas terrae]GEL98794.1 dihydroxyacetone kinase subunit L [Cellulomonas terrae]
MSDSRVESVVRTITEGCIENEKYFGDLDSVVGDGDFGFSLARGFENVLAQWDTFDRSDTGTFLQKVAVVMSGRIGGTSGPIWGTAFLRAAGQVKGKQEVTGDDVVAMLRAAIEGIKARGGADLGEKTLLDALAPMTDTIERELAAGSAPADIAKAAAASARDAAEATRPMQARRGRASYTGERSIGSLDPGAVAVAVLAERVADTW